MRNSIFVSHASEDKRDFVRPLAHALRRLGLKVWYDEFVLRPGDSLRRSIDEGLAQCEVGVVVLSQNFFAKEWPQRELDALLGANIAGQVKLIPVWLGVDATFVRAISPLLADLIAIPSHGGIETVATAIAELFPPVSSVANDFLATRLEQFLSTNAFELECLAAGCRYRFLQIQALNADDTALADEYFKDLTDEEVQDKQDLIEVLLNEKQALLTAKYGLPKDVYIAPDEAVPEEKLSLWLDDLELWVSGTLGKSRSAKLLHDLDDYIDVDHLYVLYGIPNYLVSLDQRELLERAMPVIGSIFSGSERDRLTPILKTLRGEGRASGSSPKKPL